MGLPREKLWPEDIPEPKVIEDKMCKPTGYTSYSWAMGQWAIEYEAEDGTIYLEP